MYESYNTKHERVMTSHHPIAFHSLRLSHYEYLSDTDQQ